MKIFKSILAAVFLLVMVFSVQAESATDRFMSALPAADGEKLQGFFSAPTGPARGMLADFSDEELNRYWETYREKMPVEEQRILWFYETMQMRAADKAAADRLFYLYVAVILLVTLFNIFIFLLYRHQRKFLRQHG